MIWSRSRRSSANQGYLPTHLTQRALAHNTSGAVQVSLDLPDGAELLMGKLNQDIGHLAGRDERNAPWSPWMREWNRSRKAVEWLVRVPNDNSTGHGLMQKPNVPEATVMEASLS